MSNDLVIVDRYGKITRIPYNIYQKRLYDFETSDLAGCYTVIVLDTIPRINITIHLKSNELYEQIQAQLPKIEEGKGE